MYSVFVVRLSRWQSASKGSGAMGVSDCQWLFWDPRLLDPETQAWGIVDLSYLGTIMEYKSKKPKH